MFYFASALIHNECLHYGKSIADLQHFFLLWGFTVHYGLSCFHNIIHCIFVSHDVHGEALRKPVEWVWMEQNRWCVYCTLFNWRPVFTHTLAHRLLQTNLLCLELSCGLVRLQSDLAHRQQLPLRISQPGEFSVCSLFKLVKKKRSQVALMNKTEYVNTKNYEKCK